MEKLLSGYLDPLAALWLALLALTVWRLGHRKWRAALGSATLVAFIYVIGATPFPASLLASLERPYAGVRPETLPNVDAVVMLGGMTNPSTNDVFGFHFDGAVDRVITAVELVREHKARALVLGGGINPIIANPGEGELLRRWIETWNVARVPVHLLGICLNTHDEAVRTKALADAQGWKRIILVTSAAHLRRGEALFKKLGMDVTCFACDFDGLTSQQRSVMGYFVPSTKGFDLLATYLHEVVGWWVYRWRGWI